MWCLFFFKLVDVESQYCIWENSVVWVSPIASQENSTIREMLTLSFGNCACIQLLDVSSAT